MEEAKILVTFKGQVFSLTKEELEKFNESVIDGDWD